VPALRADAICNALKQQGEMPDLGCSPGESTARMGWYCRRLPAKITACAADQLSREREPERFITKDE